MLADHIGIPHLRELASKEESLQTAVSAFDMPRLAELLHPDADENAENAESNQRLMLSIDIKRSAGAELGAPGVPEIAGDLDVALELTCQRCLGPLVWQDALRFRLLVVESEADVEQLAEPYDGIVVGENGISLLAIAEDEILNLPLAPMHRDTVECARNQTLAAVEKIATDGEAETAELNRPFANLAEILNESPPDDED